MNDEGGSFMLGFVVCFIIIFISSLIYLNVSLSDDIVKSAKKENRIEIYFDEFGDEQFRWKSCSELEKQDGKEN